MRKVVKAPNLLQKLATMLCLGMTKGKAFEIVSKSGTSNLER